MLLVVDVGNTQTHIAALHRGASGRAFRGYRQQETFDLLDLDLGAQRDGRGRARAPQLAVHAHPPRLRPDLVHDFRFLAQQPRRADPGN